MDQAPGEDRGRPAKNALSFEEGANEEITAVTTMRLSKLNRVVAVALVVAFAPALSRPALADDRSYSTIISHIKSNYNAHSQGFLGMIAFARFLVKVIKPAGVKNFKMTMLRDVDYSRGPLPNSPDFHAFVRGNIHESWRPLIQCSNRKEGQYTYVYSQPEKDDVKVLVIAMQKHDAFVLQFKFSPEKLSAFIDDPKILGISLKNEDSAGAQSEKSGGSDGDAAEKPPQTSN
jgi:hypothetical protein